MKKATVFLIAICVCLAACQTIEQKVGRRWVFTDLQTPSSKALAKAFDAGLVQELTEDLRKKIQGNRLILDKDGHCYGVLLNRYFTGRWDLGDEGKLVFTHLDYPVKIDLKWAVSIKGFNKGEFNIEADKLRQLRDGIKDSTDPVASQTKLLDQTGVYTVMAESESYQFSEKDADPWSPELNQWRLKPLMPESKTEITKRVRNHLHFMYSFFNFILRPKRYWVSQDWFFSVIKPGRNGMALYSVNNIPDEWYQCFYDSTQAMQGYNILRRTFYGGIKIPDESNSFVFNKLMLEELMRVFDKQEKTK